MFHVLCRTDKLTTENKLKVLAELKKDFRNPLIPNFKNKRAIDLTNDPVVKKELSTYMEFKTHRLVMRWYGPVFRERVFAMLLVLKRLFGGLASKDIRFMLAKQLSMVEHIYVPSV